MLQFTPDRLLGSGNHPGAAVFVPEEIPFELPDRKENVDIVVDGEKRQVIGSVVRSMIEFADDPFGRTRLRHDCGAFAVAVATGKSLHGRYFMGTGICSNRRQPYAPIDEEPDLRPGEIIVASALEPDRPELNKGDFHFMVRASTDNGRPLYFSKFGRPGPVVAHYFEEGLGFFGAKRLAVVRTMAYKRILDIRPGPRKFGGLAFI